MLKTKTLWLAFLVCLSALLWFTQRHTQTQMEQARAAQQLRSLADLRDIYVAHSLKHLPHFWFDSNVRNQSKAKALKKFWPNFEILGAPAWFAQQRSFGNQIGFGINAMQSPRLLRELFPGYKELVNKSAKETKLWERYFDYRFNAKQWLPSLSSDPSHGYAVFVPFAGCQEIWKQFGADVLVFGTSETYRAVIPERLSQKLDRVKVLQCARGGIYLDELELAFQRLGKNQKKSRWAIWGISPYNLAQGQTAAHQDPQRWNRTQNEWSPTQQSWLEWRTADWFDELNWRTLFSPSYKVWSQLSSDPKLSEWKQKLQNYWWETDRFVFFPKKYRDDARKISHSVSTRYPIQHDTTTQCELPKQTVQRFKLALKQLGNFSENIVLFVPPVDQIFSSRYPQCLHDHFAKVLESVQAPNVSVLSASPKEYGLNLTDYVYPTWFRDLSYLNGNHVNYQGALKVTNKIASFINKNSANRFQQLASAQ